MEAETKFTRSEPDFRQLVEGITDVIWSAEVDGTITYFSPQFETLFGLEPQDWIGKSAVKLVHPDDLEPLRESFDRQNGHKGRASLEFRHLCHDGSYLWVEVNSLPIFGESGSIVCLQGTTRDISVRKRLEKEQTRLTQILQSTPDFVGICQPESGILWQNKPFRKLRPDLDIEGRNCAISELYPEWARDVVQNEGFPTATKNGIWSGETALLDELGNEIPTSQVIIAHKSDSGEIEYYSTILRDISEAKATETAIREAQAQVRDMIENIPGVIYRWLVHPDGSHELLYVSSGIREVFELDQQAFLKDANEFWKRLHPDDFEEVEREFQRCAETLEPFHSAYRLVLEEKGTRWVESWSLPSRLDNGGIVFDGIAIDVTDLGRLDSLERDINFGQIFDNAPDAVFLIAADGDDKGQIVAANKAAERMHGYQAGELKGKFIGELDDSDSAREVSERLKRLEKGEVLTFDVNHVHKNASVFPVEVIASRISIDGRPYILAFDRDVTERKKAEKERSDLQNQLLISQKLAAELDLTKTQSQLQNIMDNIPGVVYQFVVHADGTESITYTSPKSREFFGIEAEEFLKDAEVFWQLLDSEDLVYAKEKVAHSAKTLERLDFEYRVIVPGRGTRWFNDIAQPQQQPNGDIIWDGVLLDVTDRRKVELENAVLEKATRTKDLFLANMSHELRTPLSAILGMTEGLSHGIYGETSPQQLKSLAIVEESGLHLLNLINEILDLSKIETGEVSLSLSKVNVDQLCRSCLEIVSLQATRKQIKLSFNAEWDLPAMQADETRLRQILLNLLGNAVKFTPEGGEVSLTVENLLGKENSDRKDLLRFAVTDNGIGIAPDQIATLFQPFVQVDNSFSRKFAGSGLGLSLVKRYVELHSGAVSVESEPGKGSRFKVDLPLSNPDSQCENAPNENPSTESPESSSPDDSDRSDSEHKPLILLAEDNDHVAMAFIPILEMSGFRVARAVNGKQAVDSTLELSPELILMDIQMPVLDGLEAIRRIRTHSQFNDLPIIALTGFAMAEDSDRCIESGADAFISKPCKMPKLISTICGLISSKKKQV